MDVFKNWHYLTILKKNQGQSESLLKKFEINARNENPQNIKEKPIPEKLIGLNKIIAGVLDSKINFSAGQKEKINKIDQNLENDMIIYENFFQIKKFPFYYKNPLKNWGFTTPLSKKR